MRKLNGREEEMKWERGRDEKREERKWNGREEMEWRRGEWKWRGSSDQVLVPLRM